MGNTPLNELQLIFDNALVANNTYGVLEGSSNSVVANMTVRNSNINNNGAAGIWLFTSGGPHAGATIEQTTLAFNGSAYPTLPGSGLLVLGSGAVAVIGGSNVVNNVQGVFTGSGGTVYSFKNNRIGGNSTDGTPLTAYPGGPLN